MKVCKEVRRWRASFVLREVVDVARLTEKQRRFVEEYLVDLNATKAAIRAGYSERTAQEQASRLLSNVMVQEAIQEAIAKRSARTEITQDRVLQELAAIGFAIATDFAQITEDGLVKLTPTDNLDAMQVRAIAGIKEGKFGVELKLCDKLSALHMIGQHLGMFEKRATEPETHADDGFMDALRWEAAETWRDE